MTGLAIKSGIANALQQPQHNHPFEKELDTVTENCETPSDSDLISFLISLMEMSVDCRVCWLQ